MWEVLAVITFRQAHNRRVGRLLGWLHVDDRRLGGRPFRQVLQTNIIGTWRVILIGKGPSKAVQIAGAMIQVRARNRLGDGIAYEVGVMHKVIVHASLARYSADTRNTKTPGRFL